MTLTPWCEIEDVRGQEAWGAHEDPPSDGQVALGIRAATELLYDRSGRRWGGVKNVTHRPCLDTLFTGAMPIAERYGYATTGLSLDAIGVGSDVSRGTPQQIDLAGPVIHIISVLVDGQVLDASSYEVLDRRTLVRLDGGTWPVWQNLSLPVTEPGTFQVTYARGSNPPYIGALAAGRLAAEIAKGLAELPCAVPDRTTQLSQQGTTITFISPPDDWITGLREVATFIKAANPAGARRSSRVTKPGMVKLHRTTSTPGS